MFGFGGGDSSSKETKKVQQEAPAAQDAPGGEPAAAGAAQGEEKTVGTMPSGDYNIHVHVQTGKNFILPDESVVDPYVQIEVLSQKKMTNVKNDVTPDTKVNFNEHLFIDLKKVDDEVVEEANIIITVLNKGFFKGDIIGQIQLGLSKIYGMKQHVMMHQRLGLTNPNGEDFSKMTGFLVVSINVSGPADPAVELKMGQQADIEKNAVITPSSVKKNYKQVYLRIYKATHLPKMDYQLIGTGTIDAYLKIKYKEKVLKTRVIKQEDNEVPWMQEFLIPVEIPVIQNKLTLQLYDQDDLSDDLAATTELTIKSILKYEINPETGEGRSQMKWINLFGAPVGRSGKNSDLMNNNPSEASDWKGRLLVEYFCIDHKYPEFKTQDIPDDFDRYLFDQTTAPNDYFVICEFGSGLLLPSESKYKLKLRIADREWTSDSANVQKANFNRWSQRVQEQFQMPYNEAKQLPMFFIYLVDDSDTEVCFHRGTLLEYNDPNAPVQWKAFEPNLSHGVVTNEQEAGYFSFRLYFHDVSNQGPFNPANFPSWKKPPPKRLTPFRARVAIYQCENLPPADETGHSDPYIHIYDPNDMEIKTEICNDTNNPIFYEVKEFTFESSANSKGEIDLLNAPPIVLNVYDNDDGYIDNTDDLIGRAVIDLQQAFHSDDQQPHLSFNDEIPYPNWYPVKKNYDDEYDLETGAAILVSIQLIPLDQNYSIPAEQIKLNGNPPQIGNQLLRMPNLQMEEFKCEIITLGLRDLVSTGLMSVNKSYIKFAIKSLLPPNQASAVDNVFTQPNSKGPNPTIRTTVQFEVKMPNDPTFLPRMTCEVFDQVFMGGVSQPSIGTFTIKLGDVVGDMRQKLADDIESAMRLARAVEKVRNRLKGQPPDRRIRAAEICGQLDTPNDSGITAVTQEEKLGLALLKKLEAEGLALPTTNSMKKKKSTCRTQTANADKSGPQEHPLSKQMTSEEQKQGKKTSKEQSKEITKAVGGNVRKKVQIAFEADLAAKKRELEMARRDDQAAMASRPGAFGNRVEPIYKYDERLKIDVEDEAPPSSLFKAIGYNKSREDNIKHYRRYYPDELENIKDKYGQPIINSPFIKENIFRSKPVKSGGFLGNLFSGDGGSEFVSINVGHFKGTVRCYNPEIREEAEKELKENLKKLIDAVIEVHKMETQQNQSPIDSQVIMQIDSQDPETQQDDLQKIRQTIEEAGLEKLNIFPLIDDIVFQSSLLRRLNEVQVCKVVIYVIEGFNFAQRDLNSASDPYLKLHCGKTTYDERENYQMDTSTPKFYKSFQFQVEFPGSPQLVIESYDYDSFFGDDIIGVTKIDLDDRFYSQSWLAIEDKPIEYRDLYEDSSLMTQGVLKCWLDIYDVDSPLASQEPININPEPILEFECRVVIWKTREIEMMDIEGTSDVYVRTFFDDKDDQTTDTHWRCQNGNASFNYRLLFPLKSQQPFYSLTIQAWDKDIIASDDLIGSVSLPIDYLVHDAVLTDMPRYINVKYFEEYMKDQLMENKARALAEDIEFDKSDKDRFWVPIHRYIQEEDKSVRAGDIQISVSIFPKKISDKKPQGSGRSEPNSDPFCPPPEGRISLSLNPFTMFNQMISPAVRNKILLCLLSIACCFLCAMMAPMIFSNVITKIIIG